VTVRWFHSREDTTFFWYGKQVGTETCRLGSVALIEPLLRHMKVADFINQHLPKDPQAEFDYGGVLSLLIAARLADPIALVNVANWAAESGAECLWGIPADKLNDDRLGRALDAFFTQRHSIQASISLHVAKELGISLDELHFDPTSIEFVGQYEDSHPRSSLLQQTPPAADDALAPAHITKGWSAEGHSDDLVLQAGLSQFVDELGPVPLFGHLVDGNQNGHTAIAEEYALLCRHLTPKKLLMISDRGTCSVNHLARMHRGGHHSLCAVPWHEYRTLFEQQREKLTWKRASYLSLEQQRRRREGNLPHEHYELAVVRHTWLDPETKEEFSGRVVFILSTADQKVCQALRTKQIAKLQQELTQLARRIDEGRPNNTDAQSLTARVEKLLAKQTAGKYFRWKLVPLTKAERDSWAKPTSGHGCKRPTVRLEFSLDQATVDRDAQEDGYAAIVTTVPQHQASADELFTKYKQQAYCEHSHHIFKGPLAVMPVFLKRPERVEALLFLMMIALQAYFVLQRRYRKSLPQDAKPKQCRTTAESLLKSFNNYSLLLEHSPVGMIVHPGRLNVAQREILQQLNLPTPAQTLRQTLPRAPS